MGKTFPALKAAPSGNSCFAVKEHLLTHTITNTTHLQDLEMQTDFSAPSTADII